MTHLKIIGMLFLKVTCAGRITGVCKPRFGHPCTRLLSGKLMPTVSNPSES